MTRLQDNTIDRLALTHGRLAIREGYADRHVEASTPQGASWLIAEDGVLRPTRADFSIDWSNR